MPKSIVPTQTLKVAAIYAPALKGVNVNTTATRVEALFSDDLIRKMEREAYERSNFPADAPVSWPFSHVTSPFTSVYSMPRERITMRFAPPGRS